jgi:hypothetical protein
MRFPFAVDLPEERALESQLPGDISVKVRTSGWQLLYMQYFSSKPECRVDGSRMGGRISGKGDLQLNKMDILQGITPPISLEKVVELNPENISISTGMLFRQTVPVIPAVQIQPREGYMLAGKITVQPDSIVLRGNGRVLRQVREWSTQKQILKGLSGPFSIRVPLSDSLHNLVYSAVREILISGDIQQSAEITVPDVPVEIVGAPAVQAHRVEPLRATLSIRGGVRQLASIVPEDCRVQIDYSRLVQDSTGFIQPSFKVPAGIKVIGMNPPRLLHRQIPVMGRMATRTGK